MASSDFDKEKNLFREFYSDNLGLMEGATNSFCTLINALLTHSGGIAISKIEGRVKDKEECIRKFNLKYRKSLEGSDTEYSIKDHISDLIGLRVVCLYEDDIENIQNTLREHFEVIDITDKISQIESTEDSFGYKGLHLDLKLGQARKDMPEYKAFINFSFEIQIRTMPMHEFAERGIASHWKYKSSEKFNSLTWKEYDWLKDLVEIIDKNENPEHFFEYTKLHMFQENVFCFTPKGSIIKLPRDATPIDFAYTVHTKIGDTATGCVINGIEKDLQTILRNGDMVKILTSTKVSPSLHWLTLAKTGKARAAIRRHWQSREKSDFPKKKQYNTTLWISLPDIPGKLGEVTTLIGENKLNISSVEMKEKTKDYINFRFNLIINDLKNFTYFISELKQKELKFKIIRHEDKKYAFTKKIFKYFKKN